MRVKELKLINFRNYKKLKLALNPRLNVFLGDNAQGKTNLLESIYIAALGKSYKTNRDREIINLDKEQGYLGLKLDTNRGERLIEIKFDINNPKRVKINRIELERINDILGNLNIVIFSPEDLKLIKGGPSERRDFLDNEISQIKPLYRYNIQKYNSILYQRNKILKSNNKGLLDTLEIWDEQMIEYGSYIISERIKFINKLRRISKRIHKDISNGKEELEINYNSSIPFKNDNLEDIKNNYKISLKNNISEDIERRSTGRGIHKDDLEILVDDKLCRNYCSQGQQRTASLSLKLAEVDLIKEEIGEYPVILLDDVLSELDMNRRTKLISSFQDIQIIITSTDDIDLEDYRGKKRSTFIIKEGTVYQE
ncbi:MAG: DNA replication/repair protein RecF [Andreesenia angusta]|nr:DNA replication/repair protein RecF [Andreesenia angusta]